MEEKQEQQQASTFSGTGFPKPVQEGANLLLQAEYDYPRRGYSYGFHQEGMLMGTLQWLVSTGGLSGILMLYTPSQEGTN